MERIGASRGQCFSVGSDQATINRLADIEDTCSVDLLVPEAFSCAVCLELMVCPISCFPCRHSFCEPCVRLITHAGDPLYTLCPICRQVILCCGPNNAGLMLLLRVSGAVVVSPKSDRLLNMQFSAAAFACVRSCVQLVHRTCVRADVDTAKQWGFAIAYTMMTTLRTFSSLRQPLHLNRDSIKMEQMGAPSAQCFTIGSDQATINRLADVADTSSVDLLVPETFSCAVCLELMVCPISCFPCRHSFCEPCVRLITHASDPLDTLCPICRQAILCCGPNNVLKNQILKVDPLMARAYQARLDWFSCQDGYLEMRLPGITRLAILPRVGAWLPGGNRMADYLVRKLFGLLTGPDRHRALPKLLQKLFSFVFSLVMFLLLPCTYLSIVLAHPLPSSTQESVNCTANMSDNVNSSANFSGSPAFPFQPFGTLCIFRLISLFVLIDMCFARIAFCAECPPIAKLRSERLKTFAYLILNLIVLSLFVFTCFGMSVIVEGSLFDRFPYWSDCNIFAKLQFSVCTFACFAFWLEVQLASVVCASFNNDNLIGLCVCALFWYIVMFFSNWFVLIGLDCYYSYHRP